MTGYRMPIAAIGQEASVSRLRANRADAVTEEHRSMYGSLRFLVPRGETFHKLFALTFTSGAAGLIGFGAFAIASTLGGSYAVGIAIGGLAAAGLFSAMFSMLSLPEEACKTMDDRATSLQRVFSGIL